MHELGHHVLQHHVTNIGYHAFSRCTGLTNVTIPDSVTRIEDDAFYRCASLTSITIPSSVTHIGVGNGEDPDWASPAFFGCASLAAINVDPFMGCCLTRA